MIGISKPKPAWWKLDDSCLSFPYIQQQTASGEDLKTSFFFVLNENRKKLIHTEQTFLINVSKRETFDIWEDVSK